MFWVDFSWPTSTPVILGSWSFWIRLANYPYQSQINSLCRAHFIYFNILCSCLLDFTLPALAHWVLLFAKHTAPLLKIRARRAPFKDFLFQRTFSFFLFLTEHPSKHASQNTKTIHHYKNTATKTKKIVFCNMIFSWLFFWSIKLQCLWIKFQFIADPVAVLLEAVFGSC